MGRQTRAGLRQAQGEDYITLRVSPSVHIQKGSLCVPSLLPNLNLSSSPHTPALSENPLALSTQVEV